jgi:branched-subunit amino acid ABC-type transport system permease component
VVVVVVVVVAAAPWVLAVLLFSQWAHDHFHLTVATWAVAALVYETMALVFSEE